MRILLLGSDTPLGQALQEHLARIGRHQIVGLSRSACRWRSERQAKKAVRKAKCQLLLDLRINSALDSGDEVARADADSCHWLAKVCQKDDSIYVYVSSYRVFSGNIDRLYSEEDKPDCTEPCGDLLIAAEADIRARCQRHLILRLGPVFSHLENNWLPAALRQLLAAQNGVLGAHLCGNPVAARDAVRVIAGVVDQLSAGAEPWGIYHYSSSDRTTPYEVAETLLAAVSQFSPVDSAEAELDQLQADGRAVISRTLDCRKIRNTFAIKQAPWREFVADTVKLYFQLS